MSHNVIFVILGQKNEENEKRNICLPIAKRSCSSSIIPSVFILGNLDFSFKTKE